MIAATVNASGIIPTAPSTISVWTVHISIDIPCGTYDHRADQVRLNMNVNEGEREVNARVHVRVEVNVNVSVEVRV